MPIKYDEVMALRNVGQKYSWTDREVMLYAYGIGMGARSDGREGIVLRQRGLLHTARTQSRADLRIGCGVGRECGSDRRQPASW